MDLPVHTHPELANDLSSTVLKGKDYFRISATWQQWPFFLIHALKSIILKTIALKKSYEKKIRDDLMALLLSLPNYTKCDSEGRILQESAGQTPAR